MNTETQPKTKFCWHCGRQLRANFFREYQNPDDGHTYTVHAQCYGQLKTGCPPVRSEDELEPALEAMKQYDQDRENLRLIQRKLKV